MTDGMDSDGGQALVSAAPVVGFRPPVAVTVRENFSAIRSIPRLLPRLTSNTQVDHSRVPVLLVPGFMSGDFALTALNDALRDEGHWTSRSGIAPNIGCTLEMASVVERRVEWIAERTGRRVAIVGWSRGGTLGRIVAVRRPELVESLVTLGTPNTDPLAVNEALAAQLQLLTRLASIGLPGVLSEDCLRGSCAAEVRDLLNRDVPAHIRYVSMFSVDDGVIDWRACLDPAAEHVEVKATHMAMGAEQSVIELVREYLSQIVPVDIAV
jgi:pimeloyl-ACP methyl ester carboxylesterase